MSLFDKLLKYYDLSEEELSIRSSFQPLSELGNPYDDFSGFKSGLDLIKSHIARKDKIVIYGDYDVDGITSTSILVKTFRMIGVFAGYYIPSRFKDGYGLNEQMVKAISDKGYKLLITIDNGITAFEPIETAEKLGLDVLVIDHHTPQEKLPMADAIIHPILGKYADYNISAAFLGLLVSYGLLGRYDDYLACLAGIAVLSDAMPVVGKNLLLLKHSLERINARKYPQFNLLLAGCKDLYITSKDISFLIVAPLNGLGKIDIKANINRGVAFLVSEDIRQIQELSAYILEVNKAKKERIQLMKNDTPGRPSDEPVDIVFVKGGEVGLIGALASSLTSRFNKPVGVFTQSPFLEKSLVGSFRSPESFDIYSYLLPYRENFIAFGGHSCALGLSIKEDGFDDFKKYLHGIKAGKRNIKKAILIDPQDIGFSDLETIRKFEPFGEGFNQPLFGVISSRSDFMTSRDGKHLLMNHKKDFSIAYFSYDKSLDLRPDDPKIFLGEFSEDHFNNSSRIKMLVSEFGDLIDFNLIK